MQLALGIVQIQEQFALRFAHSKCKLRWVGAEMQIETPRNSNHHTPSEPANLLQLQPPQNGHLKTPQSEESKPPPQKNRETNPKLETLLSWETGQKRGKSEKWLEECAERVWGSLSRCPPRMFCTSATPRVHQCKMGLHWCKILSEEICSEPPHTRSTPSPYHFSDFPSFSCF